MINKGQDKKGFYAESDSGKKFYFDLNNDVERRDAMQKAQIDNIEKFKVKARIKREKKHKDKKDSKKRDKK